MHGKNKGATARFRARKKTSQIWYTQEQHELVKRAAKADRRSMTAFAIHAAVAAAKKVVAGDQLLKQTDRVIQNEPT